MRRGRKNGSLNEWADACTGTRTETEIEELPLERNNAAASTHCYTSGCCFVTDIVCAILRSVSAQPLPPSLSLLSW